MANMRFFLFILINQFDYFNNSPDLAILKSINKNILFNDLDVP